ncbi:MAG: exodeoxyribonuclease VII large subunit [Planctomycetota bacterium]
MTGRLPFDPNRARGRVPSKPTTPKPAGEAPLSVSQLASSIDAALRTGLPAKVRVRGEVSGLRERTHLYFDLKDGSAVVNSVMFASAWRKSKVRIETGVEVIATGRVEFYAPGGKVSLIIDRVEAVGRGALEAELRALVEELRGLGWLDAERKRALPVFPRRVAVITSRSGAALQDVIDTARRRCPAVGLLTIDARVQGEGAAGEVAAALRAVGARAGELDIDAVLVTRGGGSMEDLWAFNERAVARAIVECPIPVVAAIGHETDTTIAELVADVRAATPTQAAMRLTPDREALEREVSSLWRRAHARVSDRVAGEVRRVASCASRPVMADPRRILELQRDRLLRTGRQATAAVRERASRCARRVDALAVRLERLRPATQQATRAAHVDDLAARLVRVGRRRLTTARATLPGLERGLAHAASRMTSAEDERLAGLERELRAVGPMSVLARGFSVTTVMGGGPDGSAVRSVRDVGGGAVVRTRVSDGAFDSVVAEDATDTRLEKATPAAGPLARGRASDAPVKRRRSRRAGSKADPSQMGLFGSGDGGGHDGGDEGGAANGADAR